MTDESIPSPRNSSDIRTTLRVLFLYALISAIITYPVILHLQTTIFALPGDPFGTLTSLAESRTVWPTLVFPSAPFLSITTTLLSRAFNEVVAYNLIILSGFFLTGVAGYLLGFQLTKHRLAAFFLGFVLMISPFHVSRALQHLGLANTQWLLFFIWALLRFDEQPTLRNGFLVGLLFSITLTDTYQYGLFAVVILAVFAASKLLWWLGTNRLGRISKPATTGLIGGGLLSLLLTLPAVWPLLQSVLHPSSMGTATIVPVRSFNELAVYSAQWFAYVLPTPTNPLFGHLTTGRYLRFLSESGSNITELSLYLGWTIIILACVGVYQVFVKQFRLRPTIFFLVVLFGVSIYLSFAPTIPLFGQNFATPSQWLYPHLPFLRVYTRFALLAVMSGTGLAAIGLARVLERLPSTYRGIFFAMVLSIAAVELIALPPTTTVAVDAAHLPIEYRAFPSDGSAYLAEYPLLPAEEPSGYVYLLWERIHHARLLYSEVGSDTRSAERKTLADPTQPAVITALRERGVHYVMVHRSLYNSELARKYPVEFGTATAPILTDTRLTFVNHFSDGTDLYILRQPATD